MKSMRDFFFILFSLLCIELYHEERQRRADLGETDFSGVDMAIAVTEHSLSAFRTSRYQNDAESNNYNN